jgi:hypothetical protein
LASAAAEADAFFCFVDLMGEFRDHFCQQLVRAGLQTRVKVTGLGGFGCC